MAETEVTGLAVGALLLVFLIYVFKKWCTSSKNLQKDVETLVNGRNTSQRRSRSWREHQVASNNRRGRSEVPTSRNQIFVVPRPSRSLSRDAFSADQSKLHIQFRVKNKEIHQKVIGLQNKLKSTDSRFGRFIHPAAALHVTMLVVQMVEDNDLHKASRALTAAIKQIRKKYKGQRLAIAFDGLSSFSKRNNQVLYAAASQKDNSKHKLFEIKEILQAQFIKDGLSVAYGNNAFNPHMTIVNIKKPSIDDLALVYKWKPFESLPVYFGTENIEGIVSYSKGVQ